MLDKAYQAGRIRDTAERLFAEALANPDRADGILRRGLRAARYLHSRERRLVADGLADMLRYRSLLGADPWGDWLAWQQQAPEVELPDDPVEAVALAGSVDPALAAELLRTWGDETGDLLAASNRRPPTAIRANRARIDRRSLAARLAGEGVQTRRSALAPDGLVVEGRANLVGTRVWAEGLFEIQDEGSQLVAAQVVPVGLVLDLCAGAGGKTLAMAAIAPEARFIASDLRQAPLDELRRRARRAGVTIETTLDPSGVQADRVLVDAPCTGSGVLRRHPAYRLRIDGEALERNPRVQRQILERALTLVKPGGRLVYATCSVLRAENDDVAEAMQADHPELKRISEVRLAPHTEGTDGFYAVTWLRPRG